MNCVYSTPQLTHPTLPATTLRTHILITTGYRPIFFTGVNELSLHAHLLQNAGGLPGGNAGDLNNSAGAHAGGFPWFMPPVFPPPWSTASSAPKLPPLHAILSQYIGLPLPQNLASLGLPVLGTAHHAAAVAAAFDRQQQQHQQQQQQQQTPTSLSGTGTQHPLNLGLPPQSLPQNLSSKKRERADDDSNSDEDELRRHSAELLRVKAEEVMRKNEN